jgi:hypothetical protein
VPRAFCTSIAATLRLCQQSAPRPSSLLTCSATQRTPPPTAAAPDLLLAIWLAVATLPGCGLWVVPPRLRYWLLLLLTSCSQSGLPLPPCRVVACGLCLRGSATGCWCSSAGRCRAAAPIGEAVKRQLRTSVAVKRQLRTSASFLIDFYSI